MEIDHDSIRDSGDPLPFSWTESDSESAFTEVRVNSSQLKPATKFGVFLWWSDEIPNWVHPDDGHTAKRLIPGTRVFKRRECENSSDRELGYSSFQYGQDCFRGRPALWLEVISPGFEIGDLIEIKSRYGRMRPQIAIVSSILWNRTSRMIQFFLSVNGIRLQRPFAADEIQPAIRLGHYLSSRELQLLSSRNLSIE